MRNSVAATRPSRCLSLVRVTAVWGGLCASFALAAETDKACLASAETALERTYCEVVGRGGGGGLPSMADFRRNDPGVQALLLKRPAARLDIDLPVAAARTQAAETSSVSSTGRSSPVAEAQTPPRPATVGSGAGLQGCRLQDQAIACPDSRFVLAPNLPRRALAAGVLEAENRLGLSAFEGNRDDEAAVGRYLSRAYDRYIPKMLDIGLGATTMSYTAFHHAFHRIEEQGVDFAQRMEQTYQLLKQDRKTLAIKARYHDEQPESLSLCMGVNQDIIVCDNVGTNWVYVRRH